MDLLAAAARQLQHTGTLRFSVQGPDGRWQTLNGRSPIGVAAMAYPDLALPPVSWEQVSDHTTIINNQITVVLLPRQHISQ